MGILILDTQCYKFLSEAKIFIVEIRLKQVSDEPKLLNLKRIQLQKIKGDR